MEVTTTPHTEATYEFELPPLRDLSLTLRNLSLNSDSLPDLGTVGVTSALQDLERSPLAAVVADGYTLQHDALDPFGVFDDDLQLPSPEQSAKGFGDDTADGIFASLDRKASDDTHSPDAAGLLAALFSAQPLLGEVQPLPPDTCAPPPFSYGAIIYHAIKSTGREGATTGEIYAAIKDQHDYYRNKRDNGWQKSVRAMLSTAPCFEKQIIGQHGKSLCCTWGINEELAHMHIVFAQVRRRRPKQGSIKKRSNSCKGSKCGKAERRTSSLSG